MESATSRVRLPSRLHQGQRKHRCGLSEQKLTFVNKELSVLIHDFIFMYMYLIIFLYYIIDENMMFINLSEVGGVTLSCDNPAPLKLMCSV